MALADCLDALIASNDITPQLAVRIMERVCMHLLCLASPPGLDFQYYLLV